MGTIILASASPRRAELLRSIGVDFQVIPSHAEELHDAARETEELCALNAELKAAEVARKFPEGIVLGADTLVTLDGALFGKPKDLAEAFEMLSRLSGKTHRVVTGVCLLQMAEPRREGFTETTWVTFRDLRPEIIREYLQRVPVLDKAGAYGIQERGELLVSGLVGSLTNVIGLPLEKLSEILPRWGIFTRSLPDKSGDLRP